jgi:hypothetical protein
MLSGLVAYPSQPADLGDSIRRTILQLSGQDRYRNLSSWEETDVPGRFIAMEVMEKIDAGTIFIADVTRLNFNVLFEIGYAIGRKKRPYLIKNTAMLDDGGLVREVGILDTLGHLEYTDQPTLSTAISTIADLSPLRFDDSSASRTTPVYILLPEVKGDAETRLVARIKKARLSYRSFDPQEHGRLSALDAIENVASSHGVIAHLLSPEFKGARVHNYRAAFVAGLTKGMGRVLLLLQRGDEPVPLDYRDLVDRYHSLDQIDQHVADFAPAVTARLQSSRAPAIAGRTSFLQRLTLGASAAENEMKDLGTYYIPTDEYRRALQGDVQVVLGRKGTGKSALFFQIRDQLRADRRVVVLDLKPEGFQLRKFKEQVLDYLEEGTREHTVTTFWEYLLLLEICHKLLQKDRERHLRDHSLYEPYRSLAAAYASDEFVSEGDFAERMLRLNQRIAADFVEMRTASGSRRLRTGEITELLHKHDVAALRDSLIAYLGQKSALWILFDNLDKGWPPHGVGPEDVLSLRCLLEAMGKLQREFRRVQIPAHGIVFIRNDVYDNLVAATSDRGKVATARVDWTDPEMLLELLRRRFVSSGVDADTPFAEIWRQVCVSHIRGEATAQYLVERCLMRPRALLELVRACRAHAVNLQHEIIEESDIDAGETECSTKLVDDIGFEIRDVLPAAEQLLYGLLEAPREMSEGDLEERLLPIVPDGDLRRLALELLLWHGVLGFVRESGEAAFIYGSGYDMRRYLALVEKRKGGGLVYAVNPAFWKGLETRPS